MAQRWRQKAAKALANQKARLNTHGELVVGIVLIALGAGGAIVFWAKFHSNVDLTIWGALSGLAASYCFVGVVAIVHARFRPRRSPALAQSIANGSLWWAFGSAVGAIAGGAVAASGRIELGALIMALGYASIGGAVSLWLSVRT